MQIEDMLIKLSKASVREYFLRSIALLFEVIRDWRHNAYNEEYKDGDDILAVEDETVCLALSSAC